MSNTFNKLQKAEASLEHRYIYLPGYTASRPRTRVYHFCMCGCLYPVDMDKYRPTSGSFPSCPILIKTPPIGQAGVQSSPKKGSDVFLLPT
jgi:hypothetical protein